MSISSITAMDSKINGPAPEDIFRDWLGKSGRRLEEATPLRGDVSVRAYWRLRFGDGDTAILATYPPAVRDSCIRFLRSTELLDAVSIRVPAVLASDCDTGWMLLEDLGDLTLFDLSGRPWQDLAQYLRAARDIGRRIQEIPEARVHTLNPPLALEILRKELAQTWNLFLEPRGLTGSGALRTKLCQALEAICANLDESPRVPCHRDFMARNLVPVSGPARLAVLDHQDLRMGPLSYDLAALLNDSLFPPAAVHDRLLYEALPEEEMRQGYHRAAAQRTLKAVGTFAAFAHRGDSRHLPLVAPTLKRSLYHLHRLPESASLAPALASLWGPTAAAEV